MQNKKLIIITAPSGAGKTSIVHYLIKKLHNNICFSVSAATRNARANEIDGKDYYFISVADFEQKIENNEFVEWEMVYENKYYGTLKQELQRIWDLNKTPILDIDVQGAKKIEEQYGENALSIFIEPPSVEALLQRLSKRGTETANSLQTRLDKANFELGFKKDFDKTIINDVLETACAEAEKVVLDFIKTK
jgi:guanylate kinase